MMKRQSAFWLVFMLVLAGCVTAGENPATPAPATPAPTAEEATALCDGGTPGSVRIFDIQWRQHRSPLEGETVNCVPGIVTAVGGTSFYMQDPTGDGDPATSDGIAVFTRVTPRVQVGDAVLVSGTVDETRRGNAATNLSITELGNPGLEVTAWVVDAPTSGITPTRIGAGGRVPPNVIIDDDAVDGNAENSGPTGFDPDRDGLDFWESLEGMWLELNDTVAISSRNQYGEVWVLGDNGAYATGYDPARCAMVLTKDDFNPENLQIDDGLFGSMPDINACDTLGTVRGVLDFDFGYFELLLTESPTVTPGDLSAEVTTVRGDATTMTVGTLNVENLDVGDDRFDEIAEIIVGHMGAPDIVGLTEMQDNNGPTNNDVVAADETAQRLIDAIASAGGPAYAYTDIAPERNKDGGEGGGNIRVGYLYNPARIAVALNPGGATDAVAVLPGPTLSLNPGRIDPENRAFVNSRKPLALEVTFIPTGATIFLITNHFNSKGGDMPLYGPVQPPVLESEPQRIAQAEVVGDFVAALLAEDPQARVIVMGDLNDFYFAPPLTTLIGDPPQLTNLVATLLPPEARYTYIYNGNAQTLDHILVSASLLPNAQVDVVHVNAQFPVATRVSDHDPIVAALAVGE